MSLLPSPGPETDGVQEGELEVLGVDEDVDDLLDALSSETARAVLNAIYEEPGTPSEIADRLDMSIQKVSYHLDKLEDEDLIAVAGTRYSEKGQEMKVYEPPDDPILLFVGTRERKQSIRTLVKRLLPTIGVLGLASLVVEQLFGGDRGPAAFIGPDLSGDGDQSPPATATDSPTATPVDSPTEVSDPTATPQPDSNTGGDSGGSTDGSTATEQNAGEGGATPSGDPTSGTPTEAPSGGTPTAEPTASPTEASTATPTDLVSDATDTATQAVDAAAGAGISPGVTFFLGGLLVLAFVAGWLAYTE